MTDSSNEVVRVAAGEMVVMELYKQGLTDAGIDARVVGESLEASFGTALPQSVELWVHQSDEARAREVIDRMELERGHHGRALVLEDRPQVSHPVSNLKPVSHPDRGSHEHNLQSPDTS